MKTVSALVWGLGSVLTLNLLTSTATADERIRPREVLLQEGYQPVLPVSVLRNEYAIRGIPEAHTLNWPVTFQDAAHSIGNSMAQFQPFGDPYFHGGCDLRVNAGADIHAPVDGRLEAGHYSYATNADGSMTKYFKPWPAEGDPTYFEVAVVADDGVRFEFHHADRSNLPENIVQMLNEGGGRVSRGTVLAHVIEWPDGDYHHTHYNVVLPSGVRVNPEYVSPLLDDHIAPEIRGAYAISTDSSVHDFATGSSVAAGTEEIVVNVIDHQDQNVYDHPPVYVHLTFASGGEALWDFRKTLSTPSGAFPPLFEFFKDSVTLPSGDTQATEGGYGTGQSLVRLKIPPGASGDFKIEIGDIAGNLSTLTGHL